MFIILKRNNMKKLILITWKSWFWKTTLSNRIKESLWWHIIHADETYLEFMKSNFPYMCWDEIHKNIQWHYERLSDKMKYEFWFYFKKIILSSIETHGITIVEWRWLGEHLQDLLDIDDDISIHIVSFRKETIAIPNIITTNRDIDNIDRIVNLLK